MSVILNIDKRAKQLISIIYRIIIIIYGLLVYLRFHQMAGLGDYVAVASIYFLVFLFAHAKDAIWSYIRLFADYLFIFFIIREIPINNFYVISLIFLPLLNSNNHTTNKRSSLLYVIPILFLIIYRQFSAFIIIPFFVFCIINFFGVMRFVYIQFNESLNAIIDNFIVSQESIDKPHKIYKEVIKIFNDTILVFFEVENIICFKIEDNITLVNASVFIWNWHVEDELIESIKKNQNQNNFSFHSYFVINGKEYPKNYIFWYTMGSVTYCYFILPAKRNIIFDNSLLPFFNELIAPFFKRISKIFEAYTERKSAEIQSIVQMESKISYVQNAKSSMHFIRNKLGPLTNYLAMVNDYESLTSATDKQPLKAIIDDERSKLSASVEEILEKANYILNRSNNPFLVNKLEDHSIKKLYIELKRVWESYFDVFRPKLMWDVTKEEYTIKFNSLGLDFVFVNWTNNMKKHGGNLQSITLSETDQFIIIDFENSILDLIGAEDVVYAFNSSNRIEILQRKTHGLLEIVDFLKQMNISYKAEINNNKLHLILKFIKHKK